MNLKLVAVFLDKTFPVETIWYGHSMLCPDTKWRLRLFISHLEEKEIRQLLDVIAIAYAVVAEDVAVVPETLNYRG